MLASVAKKFAVIDRTHLQALIREHKLAASGLVDPQTAKKLGELAGADTLITGTVTPFGDTVRLSVKVIDVRNATLVTATASDIPRTKAIEDLLGRSTTPFERVSSGSNTNENTRFDSALRNESQIASAAGFDFTLQGCPYCNTCAAVYDFGEERCRKCGTALPLFSSTAPIAPAIGSDVLAAPVRGRRLIAGLVDFVICISLTFYVDRTVIPRIHRGAAFWLARIGWVVSLGCCVDRRRAQSSTWRQNGGHAGRE